MIEFPKEWARMECPCGEIVAIPPDRDPMPHFNRCAVEEWIAAETIRVPGLCKENPRNWTTTAASPSEATKDLA